MSAKNLSTVANDLIESYGNTALNVIQAYRAGGERVVSLLEQRWNQALKQSRSELTAETAKNASAAQAAFSAYYTKGLLLTTSGAEQVVSQLVKGFRVSGFWTALFASIFISLLSIVIGSFVTSGDPAEKVQMPQSGNWL